MPERFDEIGLARRMQWLLVFRAAVATLLLGLTVVVDVIAFPMRLIAIVLYVVVAVTYLLVFILGLLLRARISPAIIAAAHLATAVMAALMIVQATGGVESAFSFLYLLVILDGAIIGGRPIALAVASSSSLAYGSQLVLQTYGIFTAGLAVMPPPIKFTGVVITHLLAFFSMALLSGHLARLLESAQQAVSSARVDLRRAEAFHSAVLESLPIGVLTLGRGGRVRTANAAAGRILDQSAEQLVRSSSVGSLKPFLDGGKSFAEIDVELGGRTRTLSISRAPMSSDGDDADPLEVVVLEDRTEIRALESNLQAKERLASIGTMAAVFAHELRNPLAAISGSVEILRDQEPDGDQRRKLETIVVREIERLNRLVSDLLIYARPSPIERAPTDLVVLIRDLFVVLKGDAAWRENPLELAAPERLEANVDAGQIRQMLWNLLRNAVEASPPEAPVEVRLEEIDTPEFSGASIIVRDHGSGLLPEIRSHLFEPFQTTKSKGTGLGLAVVRRIVEVHDGAVDIVQCSGGGVEARVLLPRT